MQLHPHDQLDIDYLHQNEIGGVIAEGLTVIFTHQPKFPIDYLGKWLLSYSKNQKLEHQFIQKEDRKEVLREKHRSDIEQHQHVEQEKQYVSDEKDKVLHEFKERIKNHQYHFELLQQEFSNALKEQKNLTGVYVCQMDYQKQEVDLENNDDELAHIKTQAPKLLHYISASLNHQFLIGKILQPERGITYEVLKPLEDQASPCIYIPDVIKDQRIFFHKWPKLGAYFAVPLTYNSCLSENAFDQGLVTRMQFLAQKKAQEHQLALKQQEFELQLQSKIAAQEDTSEIEEDFQYFKENLPEIVEAPFTTTKEQFIVCMDTLGQDCQIQIQDREYLEQIILHFATSWEQREQVDLVHSIDQQINYQDHHDTQQLLEEYQKQEDTYIVHQIHGNAEYYNDLKQNNEYVQHMNINKQHTYELDCARLTWLKGQLNQQEFNQPLLELTKCRIIKFPGILQSALYLLNFTKVEINLPGTNVLNWRYVRTILDKDLILRITQYNHQGSKDSLLNSCSMINRIQKQLEQFDQDAVDNYSLPYGRLYKLLFLNCHLRKIDIEIRRNNIQELRNQIVEINQKIQNKSDLKESTLQDHLASMTQEQRDEFQEEQQAEWNQQYDLDDSALPELPEDPEDDIDADYNFI